ncbi:hypothetical protein [Pseudomonas syringae]|uniref:hypothetical protein n=1 Tax=Pseudomonas syringae TaxID=317 RepID=UPI0013C2A46A|nr:hypothetical protein [Pseudomonas syringae]
MRKWLMIGFILQAVSLPALADVSCPNTKYDSGYRKQLPIADKQEIISRNSPLFEGGVITCRVGWDYRNTSQNERLRIETGSVNNIKYRFYYTDGSGSIQGDSRSTLDTIKDLNLVNWDTACKTDGMDDKRWCYISKKDLTIGIWKDGSTFISIGHDHFPSSQIAIRIDQSPPLTAPEKTGFDSKQVGEILSSLKKGQKVLTRYQEWPYERNKDVTIDLYGFNEAWTIINKIYQSK